MAELHLNVLGNPQLFLNRVLLGGEQLPLKGQALLIYLAVTGQAHNRSALARLLWGDLPEETARANLRLTLSRLRKLLPEELFDVTRQTVGLHPGAFTLDLAEFAAKAGKGIQPPTTAVLQQATTLYRGSFLQGFAVPDALEFEDWQLVQQAQWQQTAVSTLHRLIIQARQENQLAVAIAAARQLLTIEPWHEEAHRQLIWLLAQSGQRSSALAQYESCRRLLADELAVAPEPATTQLAEQIRAGEWVSDTPTSPLPPPPTSPSHNLPPQFTPFIGRKPELAQLLALLQRDDVADGAGWVTLVGEGGVGKTRLALAAAERLLTRFADGVWFVALAEQETAVYPPNSPTANIATAIATAIGLNLGAGQPPRQQIITYFQNKNSLLLLDNFEIALAEASFVRDLAAAAPQLTILITSREPLHYQAEFLLRLDSMGAGDTSTDAATLDSVQLFAERAERATGESWLTAARLPQVVEICRFVNGLPLALALAASWTRWLEPDGILQALQENALTLEATAQDLAPRHRSLNAVFAYSWQRLSPDEQRLLARLSVFRHTFQIDAARTVAQARRPLLFALVDKSLLQRQSGGYVGLHALLRQFAASKLAELGEDEVALADRHADYFLRWAGEQEGGLNGRSPHKTLPPMQHNAVNLTQALQWAIERPLPAALAAGLGGMTTFWQISGRFGEGDQLLAKAIEQITAVPNQTRLLADLHLRRGELLYEMTRLPEMELTITRGLELAAEVGDEVLLANGRLRLGQIHWRRGQYEAAAEAFDIAKQLAQRTGQTALEANVWRNQAAVVWRLGDLPKAESYSQQALRLHQQAGDIRSENRTRHFLGILAVEQHNYPLVQNYTEPVLQSAREMGDRPVVMGACSLLGHSAAHMRQFEKALAYFQEDLTLAQEMGAQWQMGSNQTNTGDLWLRLGDFAAAQGCYERALHIFRQLGTTLGASHVLGFMGLLAAVQEDFVNGRSLCHEALTLAKEANARREQAFAQTFLGHNLAGLGQWREARTAYQTAQAGWETLGEQGRMLEAQAGAARARLALGNVEGAWQLVNPIVPTLATMQLAGLDEPARLFVTCHEVLQAAQDGRAGEVWENGRFALQTVANTITNPALRHQFGHANPFHRLLLKPDF